MTIDPARFQKLLEAFSLEQLFNELGWDNAALKPQAITVEGGSFTLTQVAQKRGVAVFRCSPDVDGGIPERPALLRIEKEAVKIAHEHLLIFADAAESRMTWLWVSRAPGRPAVTRNHAWHKGQSGESLRQKLSQIVWSLEEEDAITLTDVITGLRKAFDRDRISKSFFDRFKAQHEDFAGFVTGLGRIGDRNLYTSLMLNRLMFIYFIQKKGFLDGDENYLVKRLSSVRATAGENKFHSFYRIFLRRLFHEGLGAPKNERDPELTKLLGNVPYLNGGLFALHEIEECNPDIDIPDKAFERLFAFFDEWEWHLDDRPLSSGREINPDVLGYIFEKYINQKQMGAYYTKEDITEYISKNTVIPHLLERARERCKVAFDGEASVWNLLGNDPERYVYPAMKTGVIDAGGELVPETALPDFVQTGMKDAKARMFDKRYNLGEAVFFTATGERGTLPTETWREYAERRARCLSILEKLRNGEVRSADDLITLNLDIRQFIQDMIADCSSPDLLRAVWQSIVGRVPEKSHERFHQGITILDPTCGSGAFLFAALNILEPLYEACLDRMEGFVEDAKKLGKPGAADFVKALEEVNRHPSRRYYIYKNIILHNLFGVDIMAEAVEICKLRLFLKLVAQVDKERDLEPLPDIDFNIRAGNTLVGYATEEQFNANKTFVSGKTFDFNPDHRAEIQARIADMADLFDRFREQQAVYGGKVTAEDKRCLRDRFGQLSMELDRYLAHDYNINIDNPEEFNPWRESHQPFHWFAEFYGVMREGGFDVVIGNPPYVETSSVKTYKLFGFELKYTGNLFSICTERFTQLMGLARLGIIVPISAVSTPRMTPMMELIERKLDNLWISNFAVRPGKLFTGVDMNLSILIGQNSRTKVCSHCLYSTRYNRWNELAREALFPTLSYIQSLRYALTHAIFKIGTVPEVSILKKIYAQKSLSFHLPSKNESSTKIYYHSGGRYFRKCIQQKLSNEYKELQVRSGEEKNIICLISSSLYYWYWLLESDCYHVTKTDIAEFPSHAGIFSDPELVELGCNLLADLEKNAVVRTRHRKSGDVVNEVNYYVGKSKWLIDQVDLNIAKHYKLNDEETDFIINYDIKYRMGSADEEA